MALFEIKKIFTGKVIFSLETSSMKLCIEAAIKLNTDICDAYLQGANLQGADLRGANFQGADLRGADLRGADLRDAYLQGADLRGANFRSAYLRGANFQGANLQDAYLQGVNFQGADLQGAYLRSANFQDAYLQGANLQGANFQGADLRDANLQGEKDSEIILARQRICPQEGAFVGFKKLQGGVIAKLVIPHDAERMNAIGSRKCRASKVFVHEMFGADEAYDTYTRKTLYKQGCEVLPDKFDTDVRVECSHGIHFFLTREEAEAY